MNQQEIDAARITWGCAFEIPEIPDPFSITLPGGVSMESINLMEQIQPALTPLMPIFDTVVAVFNCIKAIPDTLGPPPDPTVLAACIPELAEKVAKLLKLIPQLSIPLTIIGIIDLIIDTLRQARTLLLHLQAQMQQITGAIDRATDLEDAGLMAITSCAQATTYVYGALTPDLRCWVTKIDMGGGDKDYRITVRNNSSYQLWINVAAYRRD